MAALFGNQRQKVRGPGRFAVRSASARRLARTGAVLCTVLLLCVQSMLAQQGATGRTDYCRGPEWFPRFYKPYTAQRVPDFPLGNSPALTQTMRDGKLMLSVRRLKELVMENNLDIATASYYTSMAETDVLRANGGGAPRGAGGVRIPSGLFAGALGAGVGEAVGAGGFGGAGGITSSARQIMARPSGSYDPSIALNFSAERNASPLNTVVVSGIPIVITQTYALQARFAQAFATGTAVSVSFNNQRQKSTQQFLRFNPAFVSSLSVTITQNLLEGYGLDVNRRFQIVAENGKQIAKEAYRQQVISTVAQAENLYWDLVAARENVRVVENALAVAKQLYEDNQKRNEIGTASGMDVITAEGEVSARQRDLIVAQMNLQMREVDLKNILSKEIDAALAAAQVEATDYLPDPKDADIPKLAEAQAAALRNRPELRQAERSMFNQEIAAKYTRNLLRPTLVLFARFSSSGLYGDRIIANPTGGSDIVLPGGMSQALRQVRSFSYPEYAFGFSLSIPLLNRSAQADSLRTRLEMKQAETALEQTRNRTVLEVRNAVIALVQSKAQVESAQKAVRLRAETLKAEEERLLTGLSTPYDVIRRQRDLLTAQYEENRARVNYAKARVELDRSTGMTLDK